MTSESVLVVGPSWVGDMVMAQALFKVLKEDNPCCQLDVLAPAWSGPILALMPEVRSFIDMPVGHGELGIAARFRLGRSLAANNYSRAIVLPNSFKSALVPWFAGIPQRTGWTGEARYGLLNDRRSLDEEAMPLMVQRFVALARGGGAVQLDRLPVPRLVTSRERELDVGRRFLGDEVDAEAPRPLLALCPGAEFGPAKQWPTAHYAAAAAHFFDLGWRVILLGSGNDADACSEVQASLVRRASCLNLAGRTNLEEVVHLLAMSSLALSNDSGLMHIAAALGVPTVAIYGPTSAGFTPPLAARTAVVSEPVECAPCFQRECPLEHHKCLRDLQPVTVIDAATELLDAGLRSS